MERGRAANFKLLGDTLMKGAERMMSCTTGGSSSISKAIWLRPVSQNGTGP